jgi:hypothetical protein
MGRRRLDDRQNDLRELYVKRLSQKANKIKEYAFVVKQAKVFK